VIATGVSTVAGVAVGAATFGVAGPIGAQVIAGMVSEAVYYISYQLLTGQDINIEDLILTTIIGGLTSLGFAKLASSPALRQAINKHVAAPLKKLLGKGSTPATPAAAKPPKTTTPTPTTPTQGGATAATNSGAQGGGNDIADRVASGDADDWPIISGIVRDAAKGKGNFGLGSGSASQAGRAGESWVGEGWRWSSDRKAMVSSDGLHIYRPPTYKPNQRGYQANFEWRDPGAITSRMTGNGHLDGIDIP